jgi:uncharacterized protein YcbK (DUF882 family)
MKYYRILGVFLFLHLHFISCSKSPPSIPTKKDWEEFSKNKKKAEQIKEFENFLRENHVSELFSSEELLRQGTDWKNAKEEPFVIPPKEEWIRMIPTLLFIKKVIIPRLGKLQILSSYRTKQYNSKAGGAKGSKHLQFNALDLIPVQKFKREELHQILLAIWEQEGKKYSFGLGLYSGLRFHVDTSGHRKW